ncbi:hypothetical protein CKM354_000747700 [Cercospora kikuchii]|uniref:Uncharacterized protein n=1 Tax=Cercospora kikuchii TaxID=84275 RepID=A0A9P3CH40_9PEZI|nr:uncharacterized protein CKM354_000747700 [Cercospora kikuchii]GIZ44274.1 hypothetical protein CKM354_000747700 [Cercospora kikuchii]
MKRLTIIATLHLAALEASAQRAEFAEYSIFGVGEAPDDGYDTFLAASQSPIAQNQVFFNRTDLTDLDQNWTWSVQMSNVSMSNASLSNSDPPPNAHVALTTYNFGWPEGDNINNATRLSTPSVRGGREGNLQPNSTACIWLLSGAKFPQNVSDKWDSSSSDCTSALGEDCVQAIMSGLGLDCESGAFTSNRTFRESCASSFGVLGSWGVNAQPFGNSRDRNATDVLEKGEALAWHLSNPYQADNDTIFEDEKSRLHVIGLSVTSQLNTVSFLRREYVLCNRVSASESSASLQRGNMAILGLTTVLAALYLYV